MSKKPYLVGEHWVDGKLDGVWTSEVPGVTGPPGFEEAHRHQAEPISLLMQTKPDNGWCYYWYVDTESF